MRESRSSSADLRVWFGERATSEGENWLVKISRLFLVAVVIDHSVAEHTVEVQ